MAIASTFGLTNGGIAGLIYCYLGIFVGFIAVIASMAEMASMAPTTGGKYHCVSEFAPAISQLHDWMGLCSWLADGNAAARCQRNQHNRHGGGSSVRLCSDEKRLDEWHNVWVGQMLSLINIGSTVAFNAIASLGTAALISSYIIFISC
ncbi:hypothetical protein A9K55_005384 [Cordyceps militaris]|uniref:Uncharacterized protein n=1 Tax=Cordyceps militaris TaxID=73501 RepID=A0A2H4SB79_CORMI|nr:hypothetical protein A9K55_005384 [Cordyceps militaris]